MMTRLPDPIRYQCNILRVLGDLMALRMHDQPGPGGITQLMQLDRMRVDEIRLAGHM